MLNKFDELISQAQMAFTNAQYDYCIELCQAALQLESGSIAVYTLKGNSYLVMNHFKEAEREFRKAIELDNKTGE